MKRIILIVLLVFILAITSSEQTFKKVSTTSHLKKLLKSHVGLHTQQKQHTHQKQLTLQENRVGKDMRDIELAQYSNDIYNGCLPGASLCTEEVHSVLFAVLQKPEQGKCYVVVRGTQNLDNWLTDLDLPLTGNLYGAGRVHSGFQAVMEEILAVPTYQDLTQDCADNNWYVGFTGHSLGGAVATLATQEYYQRTGNSNVHLATFGSPRVGNYDFQNGFITTLSRKGNRYESVKADVVSGLGLFHSSRCGNGAKPGDIVTRVPPMTPIALKIADMVTDLLDAAFWTDDGDVIDSLLGVGDDDAYSRSNGYRHVGYRYQLTCEGNPIDCHSMTDIYLAAIKSSDASKIRDC